MSEGSPDENDGDDRLRCTECGTVTDVSVASLHDRMGRTAKGTWRKGRRWMRTLAAIVEQWRCDRCLDREDAERGRET